jgi:transglutaminase-like putative cysteine protease
MQQDLAEDSPAVVFVARVSESAPPNNELYWKLITLDTFDGTYWLPAPLAINRPTSPSDWEASDFTFAGDTVAVEAVVRIEALRQNYLPVLYSPRSLVTEDRLLQQSYRSREDGSLKFDARSQQGLLYSVRSQIPIPNLSILASDGDELSPMFQNAQTEGLFNLPATQVARPAPSSRLRTVYTALPEEFSDVIRGLSRQITAQATTDFEKGLVLEEFFRHNGGFTYDASASSGHSLLDLEEWLLDPESRNYRSGYCEQFASAMAVMARALGIPSRLVIGFSPGTVQNQADGAEVIYVRARNAHAWVELFMPGQGWVRFDPTPRSDASNPSTTDALGFDPVAHLPEPADPTDQTDTLPGSFDAIDRRFLEQGADPTLGSRLGTETTSSEPWVVLLVIAGALALVPLIKFLRRTWRLRRLDRGDLVAGWYELTDRLRDLGVDPAPALTPTELAAAVDRGMLPLAGRVTAAVFGRRQITDGRSAFQMAERSLRSRYSVGRWWMSWFRPATLLSGLIRYLQPIRRLRRSRPVAES